MPVDILQSSSLLIVDDEHELNELITEVIAPHVKRVDSCTTAEEAFHILQSRVIDLVLLDVHMPGTSGPEMLAKMRAQGIHTPVIYVTANSADERVIDSLGVDSYDVVEKPFRAEVMLTRVRNALKAHADAARLHAVIEDQVIFSGDFDSAHQFDNMTPAQKKRAMAAAKGVLTLRAANQRKRR